MPSIDPTTWLGLRTLFIKQTGHYHLVEVTGGEPDFTADNGADFYLKEAIRWWDRECKHARKQRTETLTLTAGEVSLAVNAYAVLSVRQADKQANLKQANEEWLRENYEGDLTAVASDEELLYWAHKTPEADDTGKEIWLLPPVGANKSVEIKGYYYTTVTTDDNDTNWWLTNYNAAVLYVAEMILNKFDLNPFTNNTLLQMKQEVERHVLSEVIAEEIEFYGTEMAG